MTSIDRPSVLIAGRWRRKDALLAALARHPITAASATADAVQTAALEADLVVLVGDAAGEALQEVLTRLSASDAAATIPLALVTDEPEGGAVHERVAGRIAASTSADAIAGEIARLARERPSVDASDPVDARTEGERFAPDTVPALPSLQLRPSSDAPPPDGPADTAPPPGAAAEAMREGRPRVSIRSRRATMQMGTVSRSDPMPAPAVATPELAEPPREDDRADLDATAENEVVAPPVEPAPPVSVALADRVPSGAYASPDEGRVDSAPPMRAVESEGGRESTDRITHAKREPSRRSSGWLIIAGAAIIALAILGSALVIAHRSARPATPAPVADTAPREPTPERRPAVPEPPSGVEPPPPSAPDLGSLPPPTGRIAQAVQRRDVDFLIREANRVRREGSLDEAQILFLRVLEVSPTNPRAFGGLAQLAMRRHDGPAAVRWASQLADARPTVAANHILLGDAHELAGDHDAARAAWQRARELDPSDRTARRRLAR